MHKYIIKYTRNACQVMDLVCTFFKIDVGYNVIPTLSCTLLYYRIFYRRYGTGITTTTKIPFLRYLKKKCLRSLCFNDLVKNMRVDNGSFSYIELRSVSKSNRLTYLFASSHFPNNIYIST